MTGEIFGAIFLVAFVLVVFVDEEVMKHYNRRG